jgi:hypothetical protein
MIKRKSRKKPKNKLKGRERRLAKGPDWALTHRGKPSNMLKKYRKYFGVDWECAIFELTALGVKFDATYLARLRETISRDFQGEKKHAPISRLEFDAYHGIEPDSEENFAYIAGYTSGGAPYGLTWEEWEEMGGDEEDREP